MPREAASWGFPHVFIDLKQYFRNEFDVAVFKRRVSAMKSLPLAAGGSPIAKTKLLLVALTALFAATTSSYATTFINSVNWSGDNNFNSDSMTWSNAKGFVADELTDIFGTGLYEGCCNNKTTNYDMQIKLDGKWVSILDWSTAPHDKTDHLLGDLVPPTIDFTKGLVTGIRFSSKPKGSDEDPTFSSFFFKTYLTRDEYFDQHRSEYKDRDDFDKCGDYERYITHVTTFVFDCDSCGGVTTTGGGPGLATPLPAALPLLASGTGLFGFLSWRRKRRKANLAA
jgi:hypothetical protein